MLQERRKQGRRRIAVFGIIACLALSMASGLKVEADSWPDEGASAIRSAQPHFSGYRVRDIETWSEQTDPYAELMQAKVPLQKRNASFPATQANPKLTAPVEIMLMQGDYGNSFFDSTIANNAYGNVAFNFWQYTDYFCPWHGAATIGTPRGLYDPATSDWRKRGFEFGIVNIPNQAYINAAHKNGVKAIACVYFDPHFRPGQTKQEMFVKDKDGRYIVADQLIRLAQYYGIDGYFLNDEEHGADEFKPFMAQITAAGLWTQFYDTNSAFNASKSQYLKDDVNGKIHDSVFVNYGWSGVDNFVAHAQEIGVDPYEAVFLGLEANQGKFGVSGQTAIEKAYDADKNPKCSVALFTPSDMYQRGVDDLTEALGLGKQFPVHQRNEYQWMIAERERMYFSGVMCNPKDTGKKPGYNRIDVEVKDASGWVGVADFKSEGSVISGSRFFSNFNIGKGVQYFADGKLLNDEAWTNLNDQDILPTWQWWFETESTKKLKADFDFGEKDTHNDINGQKITLPYTQIGAWHGGSSLVVYGDLEKEKSNFLHLFKTALAVKSGSKAKIRYRKVSEDQAEMKLGLVLKDAPQTVEELKLEHSAVKGEWTEDIVDLSRYEGKEIAALGFVFVGQEDVKNYQMNIGQVQITDTEEKEAAPSGFRVSKMFDDGQTIFRWIKKDYAQVDKYRIYAVDGQGKEFFLGGIYDDTMYAKNHFCQDGNITFRLVAVGKDGRESEAAEVEYDMEKMPRSLQVKEMIQEKTKVKQAAEPQKLDISWTQGQGEEGYEIVVEPLWLDSDSPSYKKYTVQVPKGTTEYTLETPEMVEGYEYDLTISPRAGGKILDGISYRGRFYDSYAAPMTADDIKILQNNRIALKSPLTKDWHYVTVEFQAEGAAEKKQLLLKERGVDGNYHAVCDLGASKGKIFVTLEDYSKNKSTLEIVYDESYKDDLTKIVKQYEVLVENRDVARILYKNEDLDQILNELAVKIREAKAVLESPADNREKVKKLEEEIQAIVAKLVKNEEAVTLTFEFSYPPEMNPDTYDRLLEVKLLDSENKEIKPMKDKIYVLKKGSYTYTVRDRYNYYVLPISKQLMVEQDTIEKVEIERLPSGVELLKKPDKTEYKRGEALDLTGGRVRIRYSYPSKIEEKPMDDGRFTVHDYDSNRLGMQTVTIKGYGKSFALEIKVLPADGEPKEMGELLEIAEKAKAAMQTKNYRYASQDKKEAFDRALAKAEELLSKQDSTGEQLELSKQNLQAAIENLDGENQGSLEIALSATAKTYTAPSGEEYRIDYLIDGDKEKFAWFEKAQEPEDEIRLTFEKEVQMKGVKLQYPSGVGGDFIVGADIEVLKGEKWIKQGEVSGDKDQEITFAEPIRSQTIRLKIVKKNSNWYKVGELTVAYEVISEPQPPVEADKTALKEEAEAAEADKETAKYFNADKEKKEKLDEALNKAKEVIADKKATEEEVKTALGNLTVARLALNGKATDKEALKKMIQQAETVKAGEKYQNADTDKKEALDQALDRAKELLEMGDAMQEEVDEGLQELKDALEALGGEEPKVNLTKLKEAIEAAKAVKATVKYQKAGADKKQAFENELEAAEELVGNPAAEQVEVDDAAERLNEATEALDGKEDMPQADWTELEKAIKEAKEIQASVKYQKATEIKKNAFEEALRLAEVLMENKDAAPEEVKKAAEALMTAIAELDGKEPEPNPNPNPEPEPNPNPNNTVLTPYIPPVAEEMPIPEVKIEDEKVALSSAEARLKFEQLTKDISEEEDKEWLKKWLAKKASTGELLQRLGEKTTNALANKIGDAFRDETVESWYAKELSLINLLELTKGYEDGTFGGEKEISGEEYIAMLVRAAGLKVKEDKANWFAPYREAAKKAGLLRGLKRSYDLALTRQEVAALSYNFMTLYRDKMELPEKGSRFTDRERIAEGYRKQVDWLYEKDILKGYEDGSYRPEAFVKRQEAVAILYRLLKNTK